MSVARLLGQFFSPMAVPRSLRWFYASVLLRRSADSLLLVITPIFIYQLGPRLSIVSDIFPGEFLSGVAALLLTLIFGRVAHLLLAQPLSLFLQKAGLRSSIVLGQTARLLMLIVFSFLPMHPDLIWLTIPLMALVLGLYFPAYHLYLAEKLEVGKIGRELGTLEILVKLGLVLTPLIGAFISTLFGYQDVFLLAALTLLVSTLCLWSLPPLHFRTQWSWADFRESLNIGDVRRQWLGIGAKAWEEYGLSVFLPLFLFMQYDSMLKPGYIFTSASLFSLIVVYLAGWKFDTSKNRSAVLISGVGSGLFWIARFFLAPFPVLFVIGETIERFSSNFFSLSFFAELISKIRQKNPILYVQNREVILDIAHILGGSLMLILFTLGTNWFLVFSSFSAAGLLSLLFVKHGKKR